MASQNQKSFYSQVTLDSSKIYRHSLSNSVLPPLHTGQSSYIAYKHKVNSKHKSRPLPFGSSSSRVIEQLQPKVLSHVVGYGSVLPKAKHTSEKIASPFGSTDSRFKEVKNSPGPGLYQYQQLKSIKGSRGSWKFSTVDRDLINQSSKQGDIGPGSYEINQPAKSLQFRQKMAQKFRQQRKKYIDILSLNSNKDHQLEKFGGFSQQRNSNHSQQQKQKIKAKAEKIVPSLNRFTLKDSTKKYVMKMEKENRYHDCEPTCFIKKNFSYNFIEKADNAFSSYIPKIEDSPGPGYYPLNDHNEVGNQSSPFKSSSVRALYADKKMQSKKVKPKLSDLI